MIYITRWYDLHFIGLIKKTSQYLLAVYSFYHVLHFLIFSGMYLDIDQVRGSNTHMATPGAQIHLKPINKSSVIN